MATKRGSTKKSATKKSSKKAAKKPAKKAGAIFPIPNLACIEECIVEYNACVASGVDKKKCLRRVQRCVLACQGIRT
jgi:hypothetical protein